MPRTPAAWAGTALVAAGVGLFAFGGAWAPAALALTERLPLGSWIELFVPFLPMAVIGIGVVILVRGSTRRANR